MKRSDIFEVVATVGSPLNLTLVQCCDTIPKLSYVAYNCAEDYHQTVGVSKPDFLLISMVSYMFSLSCF